MDWAIACPPALPGRYPLRSGRPLPIMKQRFWRLGPLRGRGKRKRLRQPSGGQPRQAGLSQWPVQIKLAPVQAPYFAGTHLLVAADCTAYAYGDFHNQFIKNKITLIGCPKLDAVDYSEKLTQILASNDIKSVTVVRMEVPCCGGMEHAVKEALKASGNSFPGRW